MAVFMLNICKFNGCGLTFPTLADLILHIENTHIEYDPAILEKKEQQQLQSLPLSYILSCYTKDSRRDYHATDLKRRLIEHASKSSNRSTNSTESEKDDEGVSSGMDDSNESWMSDYGLKSGAKPSFPEDKPYACPIIGCKKRYKNINGIKYHIKNGHKKNGVVKIPNTYKCYCGKSYKTSQGLKNHSNIHQIDV